MQQMLSRRDFLRNSAIGAVGLGVALNPGHVLADVDQPAKITADNLYTDFLYQSQGAQLLMVDELPIYKKTGQRALPRYEKDSAVTSYVRDSKSLEITCWNHGDEIWIPTISTKHSKLSVWGKERTTKMAMDQFIRQFDQRVAALFMAACPKDHIIRCKDDPFWLCSFSNPRMPSLEAFNRALMKIEEHELIGAKIMVHTDHIPEMRELNYIDYQPSRYIKHRLSGKTITAQERDTLLCGLYGHLYSADVHGMAALPHGIAIVAAPAQFIGAIPIKQIPTPVSDIWSAGVEAEMGMGIINDYAISIIDFRV